jgi:hypothetical protein
VGWGGSEVSIVEASLERTSEDGRVSGSKRAFRILLSFAVKDVLGVSMAMLMQRNWCKRMQLRLEMREVEKVVDIDVYDR